MNNKKGFSVLIIILVVVAILVVGLVAFISVKGGKFSFTTANFSDAKVCSNLASSGPCSTNEMKISSTKSKMLYSTVSLKNAPDETKVNIEWWSGEVKLAAVPYTTKDNEDLIRANVSLPTKFSAWPLGKYKVIYLIDGNESKSITQEFEIVK